MALKRASDPLHDDKKASASRGGHGLSAFGRMTGAPRSRTPAEMGTYHTMIKPGVSARVTLPGDDRPNDETHVFVYQDGADRLTVRAGAPWADGGALQREVIDAETVTQEEWRRQKSIEFDAAKEVLEGLFGDASDEDKRKLEKALAIAETRDRLLARFVDLARRK